MAFEDVEKDLKRRIVELVNAMKKLDPKYAKHMHNFYKRLLGEYWK